MELPHSRSFQGSRAAITFIAHGALMLSSWGELNRKCCSTNWPGKSLPRAFQRCRVLPGPVCCGAGLGATTGTIPAWHKDEKGLAKILLKAVKFWWGWTSLGGGRELRRPITGLGGLWENPQIWFSSLTADFWLSSTLRTCLVTTGLCNDQGVRFWTWSWIANSTWPQTSSLITPQISSLRTCLVIWTLSQTWLPSPDLLCSPCPGAVGLLLPCHQPQLPAYPPAGEGNLPLLLPDKGFPSDPNARTLKLLKNTVF